MTSWTARGRSARRPRSSGARAQASPVRPFRVRSRRTRWPSAAPFSGRPLWCGRGTDLLGRRRMFLAGMALRGAGVGAVRVRAVGRGPGGGLWAPGVSAAITGAPGGQWVLRVNVPAGSPCWRAQRARCAGAALGRWPARPTWPVRWPSPGARTPRVRDHGDRRDTGGRWGERAHRRPAARRHCAARPCAAAAPAPAPAAAAAAGRGFLPFPDGAQEPWAVHVCSSTPGSRTGVGAPAACTRCRDRERGLPVSLSPETPPRNGARRARWKPRPHATAGRAFHPPGQEPLQATESAGGIPLSAMRCARDLTTGTDEGTTSECAESRAGSMSNET